MTKRLATDTRFLPQSGLQTLIDVLVAAGFDVIGPTIRQEAIVYQSIQNIDQLPRGWSDRQAPAVYRLEREEGNRFFHFNAGADSWKKFLFPSSLEIGTATLDDRGWHFSNDRRPPPRYAFLGVRACDLAAIKVQDRVFANNDYVDPAYQQRRQAAFLIAVQCSSAVETCFCTSMGTGPECEAGFDLALTELHDGFLVSAASEAGATILDKLPTTPAGDAAVAEGERQLEEVRHQITKRLDTRGIHDLLLENLEHPRWSEVAERCLSCGNCTMACPTCFCFSVEDVASLDGEHVSRQRHWDSCFNIDQSYTAGGIVRDSIRSRYRQWLVHKLATWHDQFDTSGCTGCGRCITWCPVGIDLTEEVAAIRQSAAADGTASAAET